MTRTSKTAVAAGLTGIQQPGESPAGAGTPEDIARFVIGAAVWAPSVHNTQPWRFRALPGEISLHADTDRRLSAADPSGREMMISCGAALFTTRLALRYLGYAPETAILPDPDRPMLIARISWEQEVPAAEYERELYRQVGSRRTHRGGFDSQGLPAAFLTGLGQDAARHGAALRVLPDDGRRAALAAVVDAAESLLRLDSVRAQELARWAPAPGSRRREGVPSSAYPSRPETTDPSFPGRDFAHRQGWGTSPVGPVPLLRPAGVAAILTTPHDQPADWVNAGQALQHLLLGASISGVAAALHTQPLELPDLRELIRTQLSEGAYPQMILRLGLTAQTGASARRPVGDVLL
jgi:nitroreductase